MNILSFLAGATAPSGLWISIINWIQGGVNNFGWTILLLTVIVKIATSPLDFMVKLTTKKQTLIQQKCAPQIAKLQKRYGSNKSEFQRQSGIIYKKEGMNMGTGCIVTLVNMILTCVIFFTLYGSLKTVSAYQAIRQYEVLEESYSTSSAKYLSESEISEFQGKTIDEILEWDKEYSELEKKYANVAATDVPAEEQTNYDEYLRRAGIINADENKSTFEGAANAAADAIIKTWSEEKETWLWIDNVWVADAKVSPFPSYSSLVSLSKKDMFQKNYGYTTYVQNEVDESLCDIFATTISSKSSRSSNGYYILAILVFLSSFLSQFLNELHTKLKNKKANKVAKKDNAQMNKSMKIMMFVLPVIMLIFTISTSAGFGIYLLASALISSLLGELITLIIDQMTKKQRIEIEELLEKEANRQIKKGQLKE